MGWWEVIQAVVGILLGVGGLGLGLGYAYGKFSEGKDNVLRLDNEDLRKSRKDQDTKIVDLQRRVADLEGQLKVMSQANHSLTNLVHKAVESYIERNPDQASTLKIVTEPIQ